MAFRSSTSLGRFVPRYFIIFDAVVNGIVFLISLSDLSFSYWSARDFLYHAALPNILMSSSSFLVASLGFSVCDIMSSANSDSVQNFNFIDV